ncbi:MAG: hypothetical protein WC284_16860, partial [Candidimonas sp.]
FEVFVNPSPMELIKYANQRTNGGFKFRSFVLDGELYVWDARDVIHGNLWSQLTDKESNPSNDYFYLGWRPSLKKFIFQPYDEETTTKENKYLQKILQYQEE